ncbi:TetR family transcriptional regulator [Weizmannia acidilactici]|uniref:TetR family transcriptional regulator n=2 Tax=Heyndrickxia TaxID=2837504 RepID=A0A5J4JF73_9BACI|nr:TetR/AcrR family transcriptional regulator [Weizmannia acidilactici]GER70089.1 TetR family transcriptional regulator [Weizmannia acidilactici]GER74155.1 TetR family transcriptional regulator [Weizmannia acidilactici]
MEKFLSLPEEKQNKIVDAALTAFGKNGYKKTSVSDIAAEAGISKPMIFHYFGTKKDLYLYLIRLCGDTIMKGINEKFDPGVTDFFDRIKLAGDIKLQVIKKHPAILSFLTSMFFEKDEEVRPDINAFLGDKEIESFRNKVAIDGIDASKFKDGVDPNKVLKMLVWMSEGWFNHFQTLENPNIEASYEELMDCMELLKNAFYK